MEQYLLDNYRIAFVIIAMIITFFAPYAVIVFWIKKEAPPSSRRNRLAVLTCMWSVIGAYRISFSVSPLFFAAAFMAAFVGLSFILQKKRSLLEAFVANSATSICASYIYTIGLSIQSKGEFDHKWYFVIMAVVFFVGLNYLTDRTRSSWEKNLSNDRALSSLVLVASTGFYFISMKSVSAGSEHAPTFTPSSYKMEGSFLLYFFLATILFLFILRQWLSSIKAKKSHVKWGQELHYLYDHHATIIISSDLEGRITRVNPSFLKMSGYSNDEVTEKRVDSFLSFYSQTDLNIHINKVKKGNEESLTAVLTTKHATTIYLSVMIYPIRCKTRVKELFFVGNTICDSSNNAKYITSQFLTQIGHEIRNPLNSILGYAQLMKQDEHSPLSEKQIDRVDKMIRSGNHLLQLINEVLNLEKYQKGYFTVTLEEINIQHLVADSISLVIPLALEKKVEVISNIHSEDEVILSVDSTRMMQVLLNLLTNGIKFNKYGGKLFVSTEKKGENFIIVISDTGLGMEQEEIEKIFTPFYRSDNPSRDTDGFGIGLAIAKYLIERMGGKITVQSSKGKGSAFKITFKVKE